MFKNTKTQLINAKRTIPIPKEILFILLLERILKKKTIFRCSKFPKMAFRKSEI